MAALLKPVTVFFWFVIQAVMVGGLGIVFFAVPFLLLLLGMIVGLRRSPPSSWRRLIPMIVVLPAIWIFVGLWGGAFWRDWVHHAPPNPSWVGYPSATALWLSLLICGFYLVRYSGMRLFTICYGMVNLYFTLAMSFLTGMAITGAWL